MDGFSGKNTDAFDILLTPRPLRISFDRSSASRSMVLTD